LTNVRETSPPHAKERGAHCMSAATIRHFASALHSARAWITGKRTQEPSFARSFDALALGRCTADRPGCAQGSSRRREKRTAPASVPSDENRIFGNTLRPRGVINAKFGNDKRSRHENASGRPGRDHVARRRNRGSCAGALLGHAAGSSLLPTLGGRPLASPLLAPLGLLALGYGVCVMHRV
jgi:hypothetical protein